MSKCFAQSAGWDMRSCWSGKSMFQKVCWPDCLPWMLKWSMMDCHDRSVSYMEDEISHCGNDRLELSLFLLATIGYSVPTLGSNKHHNHMNGYTKKNPLWRHAASLLVGATKRFQITIVFHTFVGTQLRPSGFGGVRAGKAFLAIYCWDRDLASFRFRKPFHGSGAKKECTAKTIWSDSWKHPKEWLCQ